MTIDKSTRELVKSYVERIERLEEEIKAINDDKRDVYAEAKDHGLDVKALKAVIARRRKDPSQLDLFEAIVQQYELALSGTPLANISTHAPAREPAHVV